MISSFVRALVSAFKARRELALENVALRQQLAVLLYLLFIHPPAPWVEVSPAARNTLDSARIPRASKLLICGLFQKGRVLAQDEVSAREPGILSLP